MKALSKAILPALIAAAVSSMAAAANALAQEECEELEGTPPGLYTMTDEGMVYVDKDGQIVDVAAGEASFADESGVKCITRVPEFLDWPCSTDAARSRKFATYKLDDIASESNKAQVIVQRYFEIPEVIEPIPRWKDGEYHMTMTLDQILRFSGNEYWYHLHSPSQATAEKRPKSLQISLYVGLNRVVVDHNLLGPLVKIHGEDAIPVTFVFNDSNVVPVSYFGPNVSLEEIQRASTEVGIKVADVPMWELGDYTLRPTAAEFERYFDLPSLDEIPSDTAAALRADLEANGFSRKPVFVTLLTESQQFVLDQPQRVRIALSMGISDIPTYLITVDADSVVARCGPGTPIGMSGAIIPGESSPPASATVPSGASPPPPPESEVSDS